MNQSKSRNPQKLKWGKSIEMNENLGCRKTKMNKLKFFKSRYKKCFLETMNKINKNKTTIRIKMIKGIQALAKLPKIGKNKK